MPPDKITPLFQNEGCSDGVPAIPFQSVSLKEFSERPPPKWLIRKFLPRAEIAMIFGESGSGKTFLGFTMAMAIARGIEWEGQTAELGRVLYVCAEGSAGFRNRVHAYAKRHIIDLETITNFRVIAGAPNFLVEADRAKLTASLVQHGPADVVFIDTFARVTSGANENSGEEMGAAIAFCQQIHSLTGALVVLIHHSGKDAAKGARGWSGIRAAMDAEIEVSKENGSHRAKITKQKDGEDGFEWAFNLSPLEIGEDDDGTPITSCYYEPLQLTTQKKPHKERKLGDWQEGVMNAFEQALGNESNSFILEDVLVELTVQNSATPPKNERDTRRQQIRNALTRLYIKEKLHVKDGKVTKKQ